VTSVSTDSDDSSPLVSVVIPTYGRNPGLFRAALRSVFAQTYPRLEVVVVDDASEPVERFVDDPPVDVRYIREGHQGVAAARNSGIAAATGRFVAFLDDDDRWLPEKVERQVTAFRDGGPAVGVVVTGQQYVDERGDPVGTTEPTVRGDATVTLLTGGVNCATSTLMVRADAIEAAGGFDERFDVWEDLEWCVRLSRVCEFESVPDPLVRRRDAGHEQLTDDFEEMRDRAYPLFVEKHRDLAAGYGPRTEDRTIASLSLILGGEALESDRYAEARRFLLRSLRRNPLEARTYLYLSLAVGGRFAYEPAKYLKRRLASGTDGREVAETN
jgi:glycosyltransferase involved in cell wall biosynthesis